MCEDGSYFILNHLYTYGDGESENYMLIFLYRDSTIPITSYSLHRQKSALFHSYSVQPLKDVTKLHQNFRENTTFQEDLPFNVVQENHRRL